MGRYGKPTCSLSLALFLPACLCACLPTCLSVCPLSLPLPPPLSISLFVQEILVKMVCGEIERGFLFVCFVQIQAKVKCTRYWLRLVELPPNGISKFMTCY